MCAQFFVVFEAFNVSCQSTESPRAYRQSLSLSEGVNEGVFIN